MTTRSYADAGIAAPGPGAVHGFSHDKALYDYFLLYYNNHVAGVADKHSGGSIDTALDGAFPITTLRSAAQSSVFVELDRMKHAWLELIKTGFAPSDFGTIVVPITLLDARNNLRGGLGTAGDGTGIPGTDAPNILGNKIPWRDASGFIPMVTAGQSMEMNREVAAVATGTDNNVNILAGRVKRPGGGGYLFWGGALQALPAANASFGRWDAVYLTVNEAGTLVSGVVQGALGSLTTVVGAVVPDIPDGAFLVCIVGRPATSTIVVNFATVAGGAFAATGTQSWIEPVHHRATGSAPVDASFQARKLSDFAPTATVPTSKSVTVLKAQWVNAGVLVDFLTTTFTYDAGGNYDGVHANPASPSGTLARWDGLSVNSSGQLIITQGATAANIGLVTPPTLPTTNSRNVGFVAAIGGMTSVYPYQSLINGTVPTGQGWIQDTIRFNSAGGGAASSGTATFANVVDDANSSTYRDTLTASAALSYVNSNFLGAISFSGAVATVTATAANPALFGTNGRLRTNTTSVTATASGALGLRYILGDASASAAGFTIAIHTANDPQSASYQALIGIGWFDGTNLLALDKGPVQNLDSTLVNLQRVQTWLPAATSAMTSTSGYTTLTGLSATNAMVVPPNCLVKFQAYVRGSVVFSASNPVQVAVVMDGTTVIGGTVESSTELAASGPWNASILDEVLSGTGSTLGTISAPITPGSHTFTLGVQTAAGGGSATFVRAKLIVELYRAPSGALG